MSVLVLVELMKGGCGQDVPLKKGEMKAVFSTIIGGVAQMQKEK